MTWDTKTEQLKGQVMLVTYALLANEVLALAFSFLAIAIYPGMQRWWFLALGAVTMPVAMAWISWDAKRAYETAALERFLGFDGFPPRVASIADNCPSRWLVLLHIQMHPELRFHER